MEYKVNDKQLVRLFIYSEMVEDSWFTSNSKWNSDSINYVVDIINETKGGRNYGYMERSILNELEFWYQIYKQKNKNFND